MKAVNGKSETRTVWAIDPAYSTVEFSMKKFFFFDVKGRFTKFGGSIVLDETNISGSAVEVAIETASVEAGTRSHNAHLRSRSFLDADLYPQIRFESTRVEPGRDRDTLKLSGSLTIKGKSAEVVFDVDKLDHSKSPRGEEVSYFSSRTDLDRFAFGLGPKPGMMGRSIKVIVNVQANRVG